MTLWIAELLDKLKIDADFKNDIASSLFRKANDLKESRDFHSAISYFNLAAKKSKQCSDNKGYLDSLFAIAECLELNGDACSVDSNLVANTFYGSAMQAYRRIPAKSREDYGIEEIMRATLEKIAISGKASLGEMKVVSTARIDISDMVRQSIQHVSEKGSAEEALIYFAGISSELKYKELREAAKETIKESVFYHLCGSRHISSDGRLIANTPAMNLNAGEESPANQTALHSKVSQDFSIHAELAVQGQIVPALRQLLMEHRFAKEFMIDLCRQAPIVSEGREELFGYALWLGFEHEFGAAIHLLCPQVEHMVRSHLKQAGANTINTDKNGIENEVGLTTLLDLPEALDLYGENLLFEMKSVFTEALCFNLRNQVAHGLLNDEQSSSIPTIYAWWLVLRLVINSIIYGDIIFNNEGLKA